MKKMNKKGFTIVELVIVIAVIAILAAVLMPTFSGIISKANESAALQKLTNAYKEAYALAVSDGEIAEKTGEGNDAVSGEVIPVGDFTFTFTGTLADIDCSVECPENFGYTATFDSEWELTADESEGE